MIDEVENLWARCRHIVQPSA